MLVIAVILIVVVGPKDLPAMLRTFGQATSKLRRMAGDFQRQFNDALKEAELDDVKKSVDALRSLNPATEIKKQLNPFAEAASEVRAGLEKLNPQEPVTPPGPELQAAEPAKTGAAALPEGVVTPAAPARKKAAPAKPAPVKAAAKPAASPAQAKTAAKPAAKAAAKPAAKAAAKPAAKAAAKAESGARKKKS